MRRDIAGAAAVAAVMFALRDLRLGIPVRAYLPVVENMPGARHTGLGTCWICSEAELSRSTRLMLRDV
ncbi:hypothetical protein G7085_20990 [Tessaracoccus sp. HDW20]|nr:hypothetical protein [Tessaracoccus coleopterorum]